MYIDRGKKKRKRKIIHVICMIVALAVAFVLGIFVGRIGYDKKEKDQTKGKSSSEDTIDKDTSSEDTLSEDISTSEGDGSEEITSQEGDLADASEEAANPEETSEPEYMEDFSEAVFIGDSRTQAFMIGAGLGNSHFYCEKGINVSTAMTDAVFTLPNGAKGNLRDALSQQQFKRVYVMFGANELGWPDPQEFGAKYTEIIHTIQELQPEAKIYVQSILPVSESRSAKGDYVNNVQIATFNEVIFQMTLDTGTTYLSVGSALANDIGCLPEEASVDGVHPNKEFCMKWLEFLKENP